MELLGKHRVPVYSYSREGLREELGLCDSKGVVRYSEPAAWMRARSGVRCAGLSMANVNVSRTFDSGRVRGGCDGLL